MKNKVTQSQYDNAIATFSNQDESIIDNLQKLERIVERMRDFDGVELRDRRHRVRHYESCFVGSEAITWMLENRIVSDIEEGLDLGTMLINTRFIECVQVGVRTKANVFENDKDKFYVNNNNNNNNRNNGYIHKTNTGNLYRTNAKKCLCFN
eukprot:Pgem_evm1s10414